MSVTAAQLTDPATLPDDPVVLRGMIVELMQANRSLTQRVTGLLEQMEQLTRRLFGRSSEKWDPNQAVMDELLAGVLEQGPVKAAPAVPAPVPVEAHTRKSTPHGRSMFPETIQHVEIVIPVPEAERVCPLTGQERPVIGYEITKKLDYRQAELTVNVYKREKRGSVANAEETGVVTAPPPEGPVAKGSLDNGLMAHLAVSKFVDHLPLYRQEKIFGRSGVALSRQTMADNLMAAAVPLQGLAALVKAQVLTSHTVHHDDTPVDMQTEGLHNGQHIKEARLWVATVPPRDGAWTHFEFTISREGRHVESFFANYRGNVMSDDFAGYGRLDPERVQRLACMAHARRKFFESKDSRPVEAAEMLERIRLLYKLESSVDPGPEHDVQRLRMRQDLALPQLLAIKERLDAWAVSGLPKSPLGKAVHYALHNWSRLVRYVEDPRFPIDNNAAEQAIRPVALGRGNWLFMGSEAGGRAAATYMTLLATCKRAGVNPFDYLQDIFGRIMSHSTHKLHELLPGNWRPLSAQA
jgi:transposase